MQEQGYGALRLALILLFLVILVVPIIQNWRYSRNGNWHRNIFKMRRMVNGQWQYREMTEQEEAENQRDTIV